MRSLRLALLVLLLAPAADAANPVVRFTTPLGSFDVELCSETSAVCDRAAPNTVANFLGYVDDGAYVHSLIHRSVVGFVIQGGSFRREAGPLISAIPTEAPVQNEFTGFTNRRGTMSVPLQSQPNAQTACETLPDSGTSGWFINVGQNTGLDCGDFTVFGVVTAGMQVVDAISLLPTFDFWETTCPDPIFTPPPEAIVPAFREAPVTEEFWDLLTGWPPAQTCEDFVPPSAFGEALIGSEITRVPEPGAAAGGAVAALALTALARRRAARR